MSSKFQILQVQGKFEVFKFQGESVSRVATVRSETEARQVKEQAEKLAKELES